MESERVNERQLRRDRKKNIKAIIDQRDATRRQHILDTDSALCEVLSLYEEGWDVTYEDIMAERKESAGSDYKKNTQRKGPRKAGEIRRRHMTEEEAKKNCKEMNRNITMITARLPMTMYSAKMTKYLKDQIQFLGKKNYEHTFDAYKHQR